jgi:hypothetical protein
MPFLLQRYGLSLTTIRQMMARNSAEEPQEYLRVTSGLPQGYLRVKSGFRNYQNGMLHCGVVL